MRLFRLSFVLTIILGITPVYAASIDTDVEFTNGKNAYNAGDYTGAFNIWSNLATDGHARAQFNVAYMYEFGILVDPDLKKAATWYRKSAEQGYARAQNFLGWMYETGKGVEKDRLEAIKWLREAASRGSEDAIADYRLIVRRFETAKSRQFKNQLFEALKIEIEKAKDRYNKSTFPKHLEAMNKVS